MRRLASFRGLWELLTVAKSPITSLGFIHSIFLFVQFFLVIDRMQRPAETACGAKRLGLNTATHAERYIDTPVVVPHSRTRCCTSYSSLLLLLLCTISGYWHNLACGHQNAQGVHR